MLTKIVKNISVLLARCQCIAAIGTEREKKRDEFCLSHSRSTFLKCLKFFVIYIYFHYPGIAPPQRPSRDWAAPAASNNNIRDKFLPGPWGPISRLFIRGDFR